MIIYIYIYIYIAVYAIQGLMFYALVRQSIYIYIYNSIIDIEYYFIVLQYLIPH